MRLGYLKPGDQLPKVRDAVASLAINPNTVLKAYRELEIKGLATGRPGQGTFIKATLSQATLPELTRLRRSLLAWLDAAEGAGLDEDGMVALFTSVLRDVRDRRGSSARRCCTRRNRGRRMNVIESSGLGKRYGNTWALRDCTLAIPGGHVAALVGPNGAGKTTLLNLTVGLAAQTAGTVTVLGGMSAGSAGGVGRHRVRRSGHAALQEPLRGRHAAHDLQPEPAVRFEICQGSAGRAGHPAGTQGRQAVRRPAGAARADPCAGTASPTACPRRADGHARPARAARLHGHGDDRDCRRRRVGACSPRTCWPNWSGWPTTSSSCPAGAFRWPARSTTCSPLTGAHRPGRRSRQLHPTTERRARPARRRPGSPAGQDQRNDRSDAAGLGEPPGEPRRTDTGLHARPRRCGAAWSGAPGRVQPMEARN